MPNFQASYDCIVSFCEVAFEYKKNILKGVDHFISSLPVGASVQIKIDFNAGGGGPRCLINDSKTSRSGFCGSKARSSYSTYSIKPVTSSSYSPVSGDSDDAYSLDLRTEKLFPPAELVKMKADGKIKKKSELYKDVRKL